MRLFIFTLSWLLVHSAETMAQNTLNNLDDEINGVYSTVVKNQTGPQLTYLILNRIPIYATNGAIHHYKILGAFKQFKNKKAKGYPEWVFFTGSIGTNRTSKMYLSNVRNLTKEKLSNFTIILNSDASLKLDRWSKYRGSYTKINDNQSDLDLVVQKWQKAQLRQKLKGSKSEYVGVLTLGELKKLPSRRYYNDRRRSGLKIETDIIDLNDIVQKTKVKAYYTLNNAFSGQRFDIDETYASIADALNMRSYNIDPPINYLPYLTQITLVDKSSGQTHFNLGIRRSGHEISYSISITREGEIARLKEKEVKLENQSVRMQKDIAKLKEEQELLIKKEERRRKEEQEAKVSLQPLFKRSMQKVYKSEIFALQKSFEENTNLMSLNSGQSEMTRLLSAYINNNNKTPIYLINEVRKTCQKVQLIKSSSGEIYFHVDKSLPSRIDIKNSLVEYHSRTTIDKVINQEGTERALNCASVRRLLEKVNTSTFKINRLLYNEELMLPIMWNTVVTTDYCDLYGIYDNCRTPCFRKVNRGDAVDSFILSKELAQSILSKAGISATCN